MFFMFIRFLPIFRIVNLKFIRLTTVFVSASIKQSTRKKELI